MSSEVRDDSRLLLPLFLASAVLLAVVPVLHPVGTCTDWLEKWGEASMIMRGWRRIHEMAMIGFSLAAAIGVFYPLITPRSMLAFAGGAGMAGGFVIAAISNLIHATSTSALGRAYLATTAPADKNMLRHVAEAFLAYDIGATSASSALISAGCFLLIVSMYARRAMSLLPAAFFCGLSLVWAFQYHGIFNRMGFSLSEALHWASMSLWLAGVGLFLYFRGRASARYAASADEHALPVHAASTAE